MLLEPCGDEGEEWVKMCGCGGEGSVEGKGGGYMMIEKRGTLPPAATAARIAQTWNIKSWQSAPPIHLYVRRRVASDVNLWIKTSFGS